MKRLWLAIPAMVFLLMAGITVAANAQEKTPDSVILKGNPMGGVKFNHTAHVTRAANKCEGCHHAAKPEKALKTAHENCQNCHTSKAVAPMKTIARDAFHEGTGKKGLCIDCHIKEAAAKKTPPLKCAECHKKANV
jgi:hypothetical protein